MNFLKKYGADLAALVLFFVLAFVYCKPVLSGKVLQSGDDVNAVSAIQEGIRYAQQTGDHSWWTGSMFSGMPSYQIGGGQYRADLLLKPFKDFLHRGPAHPAWILIFYFLIIRPQRKRDKEAKEMLAAIKKGDKIVTIGGIRGTVAVVKESTVIVKVDDNTRIEFSKNAISSVLNKREAAPAAEKPAKKGEEKIEKVEKPAVEAPKADEPEQKAEEAPAEEKAEN